MPDISQIKVEEELKRDRAYDPIQRWRQIQETISWAEANLPPALRRNRPRQHPSTFREPEEVGLSDL